MADSFRKHCWLCATLGTFGMLLVLRGMGLDDLMKPEDVRWCLSLLLFIGISSLLISLCFMHIYISDDTKTEVIKVSGEEDDDQREVSSTSRDGYERLNPNVGGYERLLPSSQRTNDVATTYGSINTAHVNPAFSPSTSIPFSPSTSDKTLQAKVYIQCVSPNNGRSHTIAVFMSRYAHVIAVYVFGGGGIILNLCYVFYSSMCVDFFFQNSTINEILLQSGMEDPSKPDIYTKWDELTRIVSTFLKLVFFAMQIPFLQYLSSVKYIKYKTISQYLFLPIMGTNCAIWLYTFLDETKLMHIFHFPYPLEANTHDLHTACLNHSSVLEVYIRGTLEKIFYPMSMEFCLTSMEILYHAYFLPVLVLNTPKTLAVVAQTLSPYQKLILERVQKLCGKDAVQNICSIVLTEKSQRKNHEAAAGPSTTSQSEERSPASQSEEKSPASQSEERSTASQSQDKSITQQNKQTSSKTTEEEKPHIEILIMVPLPKTPKVPPQKTCIQTIVCKLSKFLHPCTALVFGLMEATLIKIFLLHNEVVEEGYIDNSYLTDVFKLPILAIRIFMSSFLPLLITLVSLYVVTSFPQKRSSPRGIKWSILLGLIGVTLISVFQIAVCVEKIIKWKGEDNNQLSLYVLSALESVLYWPEYFSQVFLIYHAQRRLPVITHPLYKPLLQALGYLAMKNFMDWSINSFIETDYIRNRVSLADNITYWDLLVHLAIPTAVYFRFTCTFLLLDALQLLGTCTEDEGVEGAEVITEIVPAEWKVSVALTSAINQVQVLQERLDEDSRLYLN